MLHASTEPRQLTGNVRVEGIPCRKPTNDEPNGTALFGAET
jgi:hypothetical protein